MTEPVRIHDWLSPQRWPQPPTEPGPGSPWTPPAPPGWQDDSRRAAGLPVLMDEVAAVVEFGDRYLAAERSVRRYNACVRVLPRFVEERPAMLDRWPELVRGLVEVWRLCQHGARTQHRPGRFRYRRRRPRRREPTPRENLLRQVHLRLIALEQAADVAAGLVVAYLPEILGVADPVALPAAARVRDAVAALAGALAELDQPSCPRPRAPER